MKNKKLLYLLIAGVICVWGMILKYLFKTLAPVKDETTLTQPLPYRPDYSHLISKLDTETLILDYPDPFIKSGLAETPLVHLPESRNTSIPHKMEEDISFIKYEGVIRDFHKKNVILISIHGRDYMSHLGARVDNVTLLSILNDQLIIKFHNQVFKLKR